MSGQRTICILALALAGGAGATVSEAKHNDMMAASGLRAGTALKYTPGNSRGGFPNTTAGTFFSGAFSDHAVLQRGPAKAAVYGVVIGATPGTTVQVTVASTDGAAPPYTVQAAVDLTSAAVAGGKYARWKAFLKPAPAGGNYSITAVCASCANATAAGGSTLLDVTFGDIWFCSGQSNMWLPMNMDTSRNQTFDAVLRGKYSNIRMLSVPHNNQPDAGALGFDFDILPPPPAQNAYGGDAGGGWLLPSVGTYANTTCRAGLGAHCPDPATCCTGYPQPNDDWLYNSINQFSAACWHFAEHLTDIMEQKNETVVPFGLVSSQWGGTMVEHWQPNATLNAGVCKNASGLPYAAAQNKRWDIDSGALYNGMVRPFLNMTITGALWWQGENNVFQCHGKNASSQGASAASGGPLACGSVDTKTGYACMMENLVTTWREHWSAEPGTSKPDFPFGIVTLAGGTSEGNGNSMGAFRYAQSGNTGYGWSSPSDGVIDAAGAALPNTFTAQAFDAGDPCAGGNQCCTNGKDAQGGWPCQSGEAPYTGQFMGGIHPRVKKIVGTRLAKAARAIAYGDTKQIWTGPVLESCTVTGGEITLTFNAGMLLDDAVMVLQSTTDAIGLAGNAETFTWDATLLSLLQKLGPESPMEVQLNGGTTGRDLDDGLWLPVSLQAKCTPSGGDSPQPGSQMCSQNRTTGAMLPGWNTVTVPIGGLGAATANLTGIRYAWSENPCCPSVNRFMIPCPPNSCPIQTANSTLPAVPFWATIKAGQCDWISTKGPPPMAA